MSKYERFGYGVLMAEAACSFEGLQVLHKAGFTELLINVCRLKG